MENKHPINIGTHFDYNNHIMFISTHTKIDTPYETIIAMWTKVNLPNQISNVAANFHQCLSLSITKLWTRDKNMQGNLQTTLMNLVVPSIGRQGLTAIDQLLTVSLALKSYKHGTKFSMKSSLIPRLLPYRSLGTRLHEESLKANNILQLYRSHRNVHYWNIACVY